MGPGEKILWGRGFPFVGSVAPVSWGRLGGSINAFPPNFGPPKVKMANRLAPGPLGEKIPLNLWGAWQ